MGLRGRFPGWVVGLLLVACAVVLAFALMWSVDDGLVVATMLIGCGFAAVIVFGGAVSLAPDDTRSEATERTLRVATGTLAHLRGGLTEENARAICALLLPETSAIGIAITDTSKVLALEGPVDTPFVSGTENAKPTLEVLESKRMETFVSVDQESQDVRRFSVGRRRNDGQSEHGQRKNPLSHQHILSSVITGHSATGSNTGCRRFSKSGRKSGATSRTDHKSRSRRCGSGRARRKRPHSARCRDGRRA